MTDSSTNSETRRLVHVIHSGVVGGGPRMVLALAAQFNHGLWRSTVICSNDGPLGADLRAAGVDVIHLPLATVAQCVRSLPTLMRTLHSLSPDLVHTHGQFAGFFGNLAARGARRRRVVYTAHFPSFITDWDTRRKVRNYVAERVSCLCTDTLVCVSDSDRQEFLRRRLIEPEKAVTIYNGIDLHQFGAAFDTTALRLSLGITAGDPLVGFFGRLTDQKGVEYLIQAAPLIIDHQPTCRILIAGDGPERSHLQGLADRLKVQPNVVFLGVRQDIPALMSLVDLVVVPSLFDPFPVVALEAMGASKAIVASAVEGLCEEVVDGVTGLLVSPAQPNRLAAAIVSLLANADQTQAMGRAGRERVEAMFSQEQMWVNYELVYRKILGLAE
ncbi:MAG: glycosyltransferase family 4 protein [Anaerolineae bacterium]|nr:glycosyltransferase family 4 protein [Anaerolineae bacterium]